MFSSCGLTTGSYKKFFADRGVMSVSGIEASVSVKINGSVLTPRQIEVVNAIHEAGSQNKAAEMLGISVPVLNRYVTQIEKKIKVRIVETDPTGTQLTAEGLEIVKKYAQLANRIKKKDFLNISGTPVSQELLMNALSSVDPEGKCNLIISDDSKNISDIMSGNADLVILDDPLYLFEAEGFEWETIGEDRLLYENHGERHAYFKYGAQRIGFRYLEYTGIPHNIERTFTSISSLIDSGLSFFINESIALRRGLNIKSALPPEQLRHEITAVYSEDNEYIRRIIHELKRQRV